MAEKHHVRLSDKVLEALQLAIAQKDLQAAEALARVMELVMTRKAGGKEFTERREMSAAAEAALDDLDALKKSAR